MNKDFREMTDAERKAELKEVIMVETMREDDEACMRMLEYLEDNPMGFCEFIEWCADYATGWLAAIQRTPQVGFSLAGYYKELRCVDIPDDARVFPRATGTRLGKAAKYIRRNKVASLADFVAMTVGNSLWNWSLRDYNSFLAVCMMRSREAA